MTDAPKAHIRFLDEYPAVAEAYQRLGAAAHAAGPLAPRERQLIKLALAIGAGHEGAVHAHTKKALALGLTPAELKHVVALAVTTLGLPNAVAAYTWINDIVDAVGEPHTEPD